MWCITHPNVYCGWLAYLQSDYLVMLTWAQGQSVKLITRYYYVLVLFRNYFAKSNGQNVIFFTYSCCYFMLTVCRYEWQNSSTAVLLYARLFPKVDSLKSNKKFSLRRLNLVLQCSKVGNCPFYYCIRPWKLLRFFYFGICTMWNSIW